MTPKEKAEELFNKYCIYLRAGLLYDDEAREDAKQCTLIAVDEIINSVDNEHVSDIFNDYWEEVKQEIEKL
jgi:hypothetical protein